MLSSHPHWQPLYMSVELNGLFCFVCETLGLWRRFFAPGEETQQWAYLRSRRGQFIEQTLTVLWLWREVTDKDKTTPE